jgi:glycosyltransferase involved in cell wall biosynthesis
MKIILYEPSSFGGCYEYLKQLYIHYKLNPSVSSCKIIIPSNAPLEAGDDILKVLQPDEVPTNYKILKRINFLYRNFINPLTFFRILLSQPPSLVIFNDFEQLYAPLWTALYRWFLKKHKFIIILHDPDRDLYPPSKKYSAFCMKKIMGLMDLALYHEYLPAKPYYLNNKKTKYISIPHGIYPVHSPDIDMLEELKKINNSGNHTIISIPGNIRKEKNYKIAIQAIKYFPDIILIIAGKPANSIINADEYEAYAKELNVHPRVIFIRKFLTDEQFAAILTFSDIILLNYSARFSSQSGILNIVAPYKKTLIYSKGKSGLAEIATRFNAGIGINPDDSESLKNALTYYFEKHPDFSKEWGNYLNYASWDKHVNIVLKAVTS